MENKLVLGTAQLGMDYGINNKTGKPSSEDSYKIIKTAWGQGIRYFDTAQSYGNSEAILGSAIKKLGIQDKAFIISKIKGVLAGLDEGELLSSIEKSLKVLNVKKLYSLLLHDSLNLDLWNDNTRRVIKKIKINNISKKIGISVYSYKDALKALDLNDIDMIQMPFNIFDQAYYSKGIFLEAKKRNKIVLLRSVFLQGLLLMDIKDLSANQKHFEKYLKKRDELCKSLKMDKKELAMGYVKKRASGSFIVLGAEIPSQVTETISILNNSDMSEVNAKIIEKELAVLDENIINPSKWNK